MAKSKKRGKTKEPIEIGIIGGSGLYSMPGLSDTREVRVKTPFGDPSDAFITGTLEGRRVAFLARHGRGHRFLSERNQLSREYFRDETARRGANYFGQRRWLAAETICRRSISSSRISSSIAHAGASPHFSAVASWRTSASTSQPARISRRTSRMPAEHVGVKTHRGGTYVCMEGPQFSTLAESHTYRQLRFDVIGMTNLTEAKLAREAEICYATIAMITDYDCWHPQHDAVTLSEIISNLNRNAENVQRAVKEAVRDLPEDRACKCGSALAHAIVTDRKMIPAAAKKRLAPLVGKYIS